VLQNAAESRFEVTIDGMVSVLTYSQTAEQFALLHTLVPAPLEGKGIGSRLVEAALDYAGLHRLRGFPQCPFAADFLRKHPEYSDVLKARDS
jgi:predicted GNAT family acetyltransferase